MDLWWLLLEFAEVLSCRYQDVHLGWVKSCSTHFLGQLYRLQTCFTSLAWVTPFIA